MRRRAALATTVVGLALLVTGCDDASPRPDADPSACSTPPTVRVTSATPTVLYALRLDLKPGARAQGDQDATFYTYPPVSPGIVGADDATAQQVAAALGGSTVVDGIRGLSWDLVNRSRRPARYLAYAGATVTSATWASSCDRSKGTAVVVGPVRSGVVRCGEPATQGLRAAARTVACHRDSAEAAPFRRLRG